jgi:hypothetical protein
MPSNYPISKAPSKESLLVKFLPTIKGWVTRKAVGWAAGVSAMATAYTAATMDKAIQWAATEGASPERVMELQEKFTSLNGVLGGVIVTVILTVIDLVFSRVAAKHAEKPSRSE